MMLRILLLTVALTFASQAADSFDVVHRKALAPDGAGVLHIDDEGLRFEAKSSKRSREWKYVDIQFLDRVSPTRLVVVTYADERRLLGRDKRYLFDLTSDELSTALFSEMSSRLEKPVSNRSFSIPEDEVDLAVGAKHLHATGGCQGQLTLTDAAVYFKTDSGKHSHEWLLDRDVESVWSADSNHFEVHVRDPRAVRRIARFQFLLKEPLDRELYRRTKLKLYENSIE